MITIENTEETRVELREHATFVNGFDILGFDGEVLDLSTEGVTGDYSIKERFTSEVLLAGSSGSQLLFSKSGSEFSSGSIPFDATLPIWDQVGFIRINEWVLNLHYTAGSGVASTTGPLLMWDSLIGWKSLLRAISEVVNTGEVVEPGFTLLRGEGASTFATAELFDDGGDRPRLDLTSRATGYASNFITYEFDDSEDDYDFVSIMTGGTQDGNLTLVLTPSITSEIIEKSQRYRGEVELILTIRVEISDDLVHVRNFPLTLIQSAI